jgi:alpha-L-fucosidase 2
VAAHQKLFRRVTLDLGTTPAAQRPTDERIRDPDKVNDPQLAALYFQFGRYLLISSSRPGCQPANLQGIWNDSMNPPWQSKYTININTEMNYWPAEPTNLGECVEPLVAMVMDLTETGARTAKTMYNAGGWVTHHNTDLWRASAPTPVGHVPTGGAWLSVSQEHYLIPEQGVSPICPQKGWPFLPYTRRGPKTNGWSRRPFFGAVIPGTSVARHP